MALLMPAEIHQCAKRGHAVDKPAGLQRHMPVLVCGDGPAPWQAEALPVAAKGAGSTNKHISDMFLAKACWAESPHSMHRHGAQLPAQPHAAPALLSQSQHLLLHLERWGALKQPGQL